MMATRASARSSNDTSSLVCDRRASGIAACQSGSWAKKPTPGAASTLSASIVLPSSIVATKVPLGRVTSATSRGSGRSALLSANHSAWSSHTPIGIGSWSAGSRPRSSKNASNVYSRFASRYQSGPERRYMSVGIWSRQNDSGRPTMVVAMPRSPAYAAAA